MILFTSCYEIKVLW